MSETEFNPEYLAVGEEMNEVKDRFGVIHEAGGEAEVKTEQKLTAFRMNMVKRILAEKEMAHFTPEQIAKVDELTKELGGEEFKVWERMMNLLSAPITNLRSLADSLLSIEQECSAPRKGSEFVHNYYAWLKSILVSLLLKIEITIKKYGVTTPTPAIERMADKAKERLGIGEPKEVGQPQKSADEAIRREKSVEDKREEEKNLNTFRQTIAHCLQIPENRTHFLKKDTKDDIGNPEELVKELGVDEMNAWSRLMSELSSNNILTKVGFDRSTHFMHELMSSRTPSEQKLFLDNFYPWLNNIFNNVYLAVEEYLNKPTEANKERCLQTLQVSRQRLGEVVLK